MRLLLFALFVISNLFSGTRSGAVNNNGQISNAFEAFGYAPACVASALASCEFSSTKNSSVNIGELIEIIQSLSQEIKLQRENFLSEIQVLRQELNSEAENEKKNTDTLWSKLENVTHTLFKVETIVQKVTSDKSSPKDCASALVEEKQELKHWRNCAEIKQDGIVTSGVQTVYPFGDVNPKPVKVYCDQTTDGGGWTVIQNREALPIREDFLRSWNDYVVGFGNVTGEYWLGLDNIHALTNSTPMELRVDIGDWEGYVSWAKYSKFHVGDAESKYLLTVEEYSGNAGDSLGHPKYKDQSSNGKMFSTKDQDNDYKVEGSCIKKERLGGWWYNWCLSAQLNGYQFKGNKARNGEGILWSSFNGWSYSHMKASMKVRPISSDS